MALETQTAKRSTTQLQINFAGRGKGAAFCMLRPFHLENQPLVQASAISVSAGAERDVVHSSPAARRVIVNTVISSSCPKSMAACIASLAVGFFANRAFILSKPNNSPAGL